MIDYCLKISGYGVKTWDGMHTQADHLEDQMKEGV